VDHEVTGLGAAFDAVAEAAGSRRLTITSSEIVGLVPASALGPGEAEHVRLEGFDPDRQILDRLAEVAA
jgi:glutamate formiminotransferase